MIAHGKTLARSLSILAQAEAGETVGVCCFTEEQARSMWRLHLRGKASDEALDRIKFYVSGKDEVGRNALVPCPEAKQ